MPDTSQPASAPAFLNLGFRPFFAGAIVLACITMLVWSGLSVFGWQWHQTAMPAVTWHAHEMIFGYGMAVIAGFLLTAVKNWTGIQTLSGIPLLALFLLWLCARIALLAGTGVALELAAIADCLFIALLVVALAVPVVRVRQWRQMGILSKLFLLLLSNLLFYAGVLGLYPDGTRAGLYSGLYMIMALIFAMARRVLPFFIEKGIESPVALINRAWLDMASLVLLVLFWIADILKPDTLPVAILAALLCLLHAMRLAGWYAAGLWHKPLLWVLYTGYGALVIGFALKAAVPVFGIAPYLPLHAFGYGGIGLFTVGMMARVTLGHTGRNVFEAPAVLFWIFAILGAGAVIRVVFPLADPQHYLLWIGLAQLFWIISFALLLVVLLPMLVKPRVDGQPG
ncbi:MAG: NnrS family protein [Gammaproteobacteria bacterium]